MTDSWKGRGNQYIQFIRVLYCKLPTNCMQLPAFPLEAMLGTKPLPQRWEAIQNYKAYKYVIHHKKEFLQIVMMEKFPVKNGSFYIHRRHYKYDNIYENSLFQ